MKLLRVLCLPLALVAVSCGGDDTDDVEAFCELLRELEAGDTIDIDEDAEAAMATMQDLRDAAPASIRDDLDTVLAVFDQVAELEAGGQDDEDSFGEVFELLFDPEFIAANERLEQFGVDECGLEPSDAGDVPTDADLTEGDLGDDGLSDGRTSDETIAPTGAGLITEAADVPDPLFDPIFDDDVVDPSELNINGLQYHLDVNHTDAPWRTRLMSFSMGGSVGVGGLELDDVAVEVCNAVAEYVATFEPDWEITIESYEQDDTGQYNYVGDLVTGTARDGC